VQGARRVVSEHHPMLDGAVRGPGQQPGARLGVEGLEVVQLHR
jgi:hypothetical protein